jgi:hypothetical protein
MGHCSDDLKRGNYYSTLLYMDRGVGKEVFLIERVRRVWYAFPLPKYDVIGRAKSRFNMHACE